MQDWHSQGWFCLAGFIKHIQTCIEPCRICTKHLHLIQKRGTFPPQVLYLDVLCGTRVWVVSSRKVEAAEPLGAGECGARQDHSKCFRGLRTHLQPRLPWHEEAFSAWEKPQGYWGSSLMTSDIPTATAMIQLQIPILFVVQNKSKALVCRTAIKGSLGHFRAPLVLPANRRHCCETPE